MPPGEFLEKIFRDRWMDIARFNRIDRRHARAGAFIKVPKRLDDLADFQPVPAVYPAAEQEEQVILIDLSEQFLGAYERGALKFDMPITSGNPAHETPVGEFRVTAAHRVHQSCLYTVEGTARPYPMTYALQFYVDRNGISYWIHGRDLPGYPASHGCIGLYDESMQQREYGVPRDPMLSDAKRLFIWAVRNAPTEDRMITLPQGPKVYIVGRAPVWGSR
ncbi:L,D-transpeptidase [Nitrospira sp. Nam80]